MTCCKCIEVPTLQSVYDSETAEYVPGTEVNRDLVYEAMALTGSAYGNYESAVTTRIWADYRYRMLASCDEDMWVQVLADRLTAEAYTAVAAMEAVADSSATVSTAAGTKTYVHGARTDNLGRTDEDLPDNFTDSYTYPTSRGTNKNEYGSQTDTETDGKQTALALRELMDNLRDPLDALMRAISGCWLNRW